MPVAPGPSRRLVALILAVSTVLGILFVTVFRSQPFRDDSQPLSNSAAGSKLAAANLDLSSSLTSGPAIAPKLGNETIKAELGRASWKLFHTIMARFPDEPTPDESLALKNYVYLFQRLYPCGECAEHFHQILQKFPPQTSSRSTAAVWACHVHNEVNKSLNKEIFDCSQIGEFYDCGCAEDENDISGAAGGV